MSDRLLTRKRAIIETINDELKNIAQVEHSRHRSFDNFIVNMLGALAAYCFFPKKPCIVCERVVDTQLALFWIRRTHVKITSIIRDYQGRLVFYKIARIVKILNESGGLWKATADVKIGRIFWKNEVEINCVDFCHDSAKQASFDGTYCSKNWKSWEFWIENLGNFGRIV